MKLYPLPVINLDTSEHQSLSREPSSNAAMQAYLLHRGLPVPNPVVRRLRRAGNSAKRWLSLPMSLVAARRGRVQMPRVLTHTVTFGCNARCVFCNSWKLSTQDELNLQEIEGIYSQLPAMDAVRLTGGEPFLRRDLSEIAALATDILSPALLLISSNGFLEKRILDFCQKREPATRLELSISIDGVGQFHNEIRGNSTAWKSAFQTLQEIASRQQEWNIGLIVNQTIATNEGLIEYEKLHDLLQPLGVEHHLIIAYEESATYSLERSRVIEQGESFRAFAELDHKLLHRTLDIAYDHNRELPWHRRLARDFYLDGIRSCLLKQGSKCQPTCQALHTTLRIFPNGDVPVCQFNSQIVGNLRQQQFAEIWSSVSATEQRKWVRGCSGCWAECEVTPSALYTLDILRSMK